MTEIVNEFVFDDHFLPFRDPRILTRNKIKKFLPGVIGKTYEFFFMTRMLFWQPLADNAYAHTRNTFARIKAEGMCDVKHIKDTNWNSHKIRIAGSGLETFVLRGDPEYARSDDQKTKTTKLPVLMDMEEKNLTLFDYPTLPLEKFSHIDINYRFACEIDLGRDLNYGERQFTKKPGKTRRYDSFSQREIQYFYGKPGRVHIRIGDATLDQLQKAVIGEMIYPTVKRDNLKISAEISLKNGPSVYVGNISSDGCFPFYRGRQDSSPTTRPQPALVNT